MHYYELKFSCENIPNEIFRRPLPPHLNTSLAHLSPASRSATTQKAAPPQLRLVSFVDMYARVEEEILYLHGTPHEVGRMPFHFPSHAALHQSLRVWAGALYHHSTAVDMFVLMLKKRILAKSKTKTFLCLHLRRDDFVHLGWAASTLNVSSISASLESIQRREGESVYIATDDPALHKNAALRSAVPHVYFWQDFVRALLAEDHPDGAMLGWADYVGLVEQRTCVRARHFMGTHCSSFSGGVVACRRGLWGSGVKVDVLL